MLLLNIFANISDFFVERRIITANPDKGLVQLKPLMSRHFPFRAFHDAYVYIDENREKTMKVLIDVDDLREDNLSPASGPDLKPAIDHI